MFTTLPSATEIRYRIFFSSIWPRRKVRTEPSANPVTNVPFGPPNFGSGFTPSYTKSSGFAHGTDSAASATRIVFEVPSEKIFGNAGPFDSPSSSHGRCSAFTSFGPMNPRRYVSHGCAAGAKFTVGSYLVPAALPADATVIAANGGSDYIYLPDGDAARLAKIVRLLQSRKEYGSIFVKSRYCQDRLCSNLPGVLPMTLVKLESTSISTPDLMVSFDYDEDAATAVNGAVPGTEYESMQNNWGMHGSFGPRDVHNTLIAFGPSFKSGFVDRLPSGNVDVAPTVAHLLGLSLPGADGRVLHEALRRGRSEHWHVRTHRISSPIASGLTIQNPTSPDGADVDPNAHHYGFEVIVKELWSGEDDNRHGDDRHRSARVHRYFDKARAYRW